MNTRHLVAALAVAAIGTPALAYQVITPTQDERGYVSRWDPSVQGKTRAQVKAELAQAQAQNYNAVRIGVFPTPKAAKAADRAAVRGEALNVSRTPLDAQYLQQ